MQGARCRRPARAHSTVLIAQDALSSTGWTTTGHRRWVVELLAKAFPVSRRQTMGPLKLVGSQEDSLEGRLAQKKFGGWAKQFNWHLSEGKYLCARQQVSANTWL